MLSAAIGGLSDGGASQLAPSPNLNQDSRRRRGARCAVPGARSRTEAGRLTFVRTSSAYPLQPGQPAPHPTAAARRVPGPEYRRLPPPPVPPRPFKPPPIPRPQPPVTWFASTADSPVSIVVPTPSNVTPAVCEKALPHRSVAPVPKWTRPYARIFPAKSVLEPRSAAVPGTIQYTLLPAPTLLTSTVVPGPISSVLLIWNTHSPVPLSLSVEFSAKS